MSASVYHTWPNTQKQNLIRALSSTVCSSVRDRQEDVDAPQQQQQQQKPTAVFSRVLQELRRQQQQGQGSSLGQGSRAVSSNAAPLQVCGAQACSHGMSASDACGETMLYGGC